MYDKEDRGKFNLVKYDDISKHNQKEYFMRELALCCTLSIMVRKCVIEKIGYMDENLKSWQDDDLMVSVGMRYKIVYCDKPVAVIGPSSKSIVSNWGNLYNGCKGIVKKHKSEVIRYTSYFRYCVWQMRILALWARYKE